MPEGSFGPIALDVLEALGRAGAATPKDLLIAILEGPTRPGILYAASTVTDILIELQSAGLAQRVPARPGSWAITERGRTRLATQRGPID